MTDLRKALQELYRSQAHSEHSPGTGEILEIDGVKLGAGASASRDGKYLPIRDGLLNHFNPVSLVGEYEDGESVDKWTDEVGTFDLETAPGRESPTLRYSGIAGQPGLEFDGTPLAGGEDQVYDQPMTYFLVTAHEEPGQSAHAVDAWEGDSNTQPTERQAIWYSANSDWRIWAGQDFGTNQPADGVINIHTVIVDDANTVYRLNGDVVAENPDVTEEPGPKSMRGMILGDRYQYGEPLRGIFGDVVRYDRRLSTAEIEQVETALARNNNLVPLTTADTGKATEGWIEAGRHSFTVDAGSTYNSSAVDIDREYPSVEGVRWRISTSASASNVYFELVDAEVPEDTDLPNVTSDIIPDDGEWEAPFSNIMRHRTANYEQTQTKKMYPRLSYPLSDATARITNGDSQAHDATCIIEVWTGGTPQHHHRQ